MASKGKYFDLGRIPFSYESASEIKLIKDKILKENWNINHSYLLELFCKLLMK